MKANDFYQRVAARLGTDMNSAKAITLSTLESMRHCLNQEVAADFAAQLPRDMEHGLQNSERDELFDKELFIGPLMNLADTEAAWDQSLGGLDLVSVHNFDDASRQVRGVFSVIKECVPEDTARRVADCMPSEVNHWFDLAP